MTLKPNSEDAARTDRAEDCPGVQCPACGSLEVVQAYMWSTLRMAWRKGSRCLVCGDRYPVSNKVFAGLRRPVLGEPNETNADKYTYMLHTPMRSLHTVVCLGGLFVGLATAVILMERFDQEILLVVFLPIMFSAWWLGRRLQPPEESIPGKCLNCRYNLRGQTEGRCPECGTLFDLEDVAAPNRKNAIDDEGHPGRAGR